MNVLAVLLAVWALSRLTFDRRKRLMAKGRHQPDHEDQPHYFEGPDLTPAEHAFVLRAIRAYVYVGPMKADVVNKFDTATRIDLPLPSGQLDWDWLDQEARRRGCSWTDAWADLIGKRESKERGNA